MASTTSRPARWAAAISKAEEGIANIRDAFGELESLKEEYQEWLDNLPEMSQGTAVEEKLQAVTDLDTDEPSALDEIESALSDLADADLPRGFGRD